MPEPKMISPMLDNFIMGGAISEHHGVRCYPAIENESGDKYIVKVISVPATPAQLDALLLTGAYPDKASALSYFADMAKDVLNEVETLEKLSDLEGFTAYSNCQMVPTDTGDGFEIYLLGTYKRALDKYFKGSSFTHLDALNLGIDLCSALSVSRKLGYLFIDLKPGNVYVNDNRQFQIGDLGFVRLDSLKYASVPEKYLSTYTPPEITDAFSQLNDTMDVYAVGLILYQAYNNGELPFNGDVQPGDNLPAPQYADYEMSEIILKACANNSQDRWQDPTQLGQAIISYMQRNGAADTPIVPSSAPAPESEETIPEETEDAELIPTSAVVLEEISAETDDVNQEEQPPADTLEEVVEEISLDQADDVALTEEVADMLNQADELATIAVPEPVVVPDHVEVSVPAPDAQETETTEEMVVQEETQEQSVEADEAVEAAETEDAESSEPEDEDEDTPKRKGKWVGKLICVLLILALLIGGYFFYKNY